MKNSELKWKLLEHFRSNQAPYTQNEVSLELVKGEGWVCKVANRWIRKTPNRLILADALELIVKESPLAIAAFLGDTSVEPKKYVQSYGKKWARRVSESGNEKFHLILKNFLAPKNMSPLTILRFYEVEIKEELENQPEGTKALWGKMFVSPDEGHFICSPVKNFWYAYDRGQPFNFEMEDGVDIGDTIPNTDQKYAGWELGYSYEKWEMDYNEELQEWGQYLTAGTDLEIWQSGENFKGTLEGWVHTTNPDVAWEVPAIVVENVGYTEMVCAFQEYGKGGLLDLIEDEDKSLVYLNELDQMKVKRWVGNQRLKEV